MIYYCCAPGCAPGYPGLSYAASVSRHPCGPVAELSDGTAPAQAPTVPPGHVQAERLDPAGGAPMTRRLCYIAAPYGADPAEMLRWYISADESAAWHAAKAQALALLALRRGLVPVSEHLELSEVYGRPELPRVLADGLGRNCTPASVVASWGCMWMLLRDDYSCSPSYMGAVRAWNAAGGRDVRRDSWEGWGHALDDAGLADLHHHLRRPPTGPTWWDHLRALRQWGQP